MRRTLILGPVLAALVFAGTLVGPHGGVPMAGAQAPPVGPIPAPLAAPLGALVGALLPLLPPGPCVQVLAALRGIGLQLPPNPCASAPR